MAKCFIFGILTVGMIIWSRSSLRKPHSHGFFRFFAFEALSGLLLLNADYWFLEPLSLPHIISWLLLIISLVMAVPGFYLLHVIGKPNRGIEDTTALVSGGLYQYVRHPLYSSLLMLGWGILFKNLSLFSATLALAATTFLVATAVAEETENVQKFGSQYVNYMKTTKRFIPFLF